jgi:RNA polymerase sigma-70 factor (ECF subfamily)
MSEPRVPVNELAKVCARSADAQEWEELLRRCTPIAALVAARVSRLWLGSVTAASVDDIVQEVFLKLCEQERRILREFKPQGEDSFLGLLRIVSASVANDYFRRMRSEKRGGKVVTVALDDGLTSNAAAARDGSARMQRAVLFAELDRRLRAAPGAISERDRAIFWLYYLQGLTAEEIADLPVAGLSAKGVESALRRVTQWLRGELKSRKPGSQREPVQEPCLCGNGNRL